MPTTWNWGQPFLFFIFLKKEALWWHGPWVGWGGVLSQQSWSVMIKCAGEGGGGKRWDGCICWTTRESGFLDKEASPSLGISCPLRSIPFQDTKEARKRGGGSNGREESKAVLCNESWSYCWNELWCLITLRDVQNGVWFIILGQDCGLGLPRSTWSL